MESRFFVYLLEFCNPDGLFTLMIPFQTICNIRVFESGLRKLGLGAEGARGRASYDSCHNSEVSSKF